jgi:hypothetical protein
MAMDTPLNDAIKMAEEKLRKLKAKKSDTVFHCPICGNYYENLGNYDELKMCGACYAKNKTAEMQRLADTIVGGTIVDVEVDPVDPTFPKPDKPSIKKITVLKNGKKIELTSPPEMHYIL